MIGKFGWRRDLPDFRDYTVKDVDYLALGKAEKEIDLSGEFPKCYQQGNIGSCTANAACGVVQYQQKRAFGHYVDPSRLFNYKTSRYLAGITGDEGSYLRSTMGALVLFGVAPEKYWKYTDDEKLFDKEPDAKVYALADNYEALEYVRLDPSGQSGEKTLQAIKESLTAGWAPMFGFTVYDSISEAEETGIIPYPNKKTDSVAGGHAIVAVGYNDKDQMLKIRNSWGEWGPNEGYLYMPYKYVTNYLADDFWIITSMEYVETGQFGE